MDQKDKMKDTERHYNRLTVTKAKKKGSDRKEDRQTDRQKN